MSAKKPVAAAVARLRDYACHAKSVADTSPKYAVKLKAQSRAEAYRLAAAIVQRAYREERGFAAKV